MPDSSGATILDDMPESIVVDEILARLPAKDVLRCRAVRKSWRSATSTQRFMLDHHLRQPPLPILQLPDVGGEQGCYVVFSEDGAEAPREKKLCPILQYDKHNYSACVNAVCDGILIVGQGPKYYVYNPAIHKCVPLPKPHFGKGMLAVVTGLYRHHPSGEYRVLWLSRFSRGDNDGIYILKLGSSDKLRRIGPLPPSVEHAVHKELPYAVFDPPVYHRQSLHWGLQRGGILVFDTAVETFRWMLCPSWLGNYGLLFDMEGTLAFCGSHNCLALDIDIWVMRDYEAETWALMYQIDLSKVPPSPLSSARFFRRVAALKGRELLIQFRTRQLLRYNVHGKLLGTVEVKGDKDSDVRLTWHCIQESIMPLVPFCETKEEDDASFFPLQESSMPPVPFYETQEEDDASFSSKRRQPPRALHRLMHIATSIAKKMVQVRKLCSS